MTEDHRDDASASRTCAGVVDGATVERFADAWRLDAKPHDRTLSLATEPGHLDMRAYTFDGMNWDGGGESPIAYVSLLAGVVRDRQGPGAHDSVRG
jgi:hypothetical protein